MRNCLLPRLPENDQIRTRLRQIRIEDDVDQNADFLRLEVVNQKAILQASKLRWYDPPTYRLMGLTWTATSVAKNIMSLRVSKALNYPYLSYSLDNG